MTLFDTADPTDVLRTAHVSDDGLYRYNLTRMWGDASTVVTWIMLNPSTADALVDDPTIRKCVGFARRWGCGGIQVVNLFAWRATEPAELAACTDPVGPSNRAAIKYATLPPRLVVAAWGASLPRYWSARPGNVVADLRSRGIVLHHLGLTKAGHPRHPLILPYATPLQRWAA